ncbi:hypothetical protein QBC44DRAFT_156798 [Cladorrhinum sp. PSN332]|nr:hypothetical protein QBC44DRAFT_156798 [Cladorrhinum sp. PSN332]
MSTSSSSSHILTPATPFLPASILQTLANFGPLDQVANSPNSVRHHIYSHGMRNKATSKLDNSMLFWVYQTGRHGPQNGFRLCLVHQGFYIKSPEKKQQGDEEDEIDKLEKPIPQGHMEVFILGKQPRWPLLTDEGDYIVFGDDEGESECGKERAGGQP